MLEEIIFYCIYCYAGYKINLKLKVNKMKKTFKVSQVRDLLNQVYNEKITFSRFVEILNEHAEGKVLSITDIMAILPPVTFLEKVNRVEVIDQNGRSYVNWKPINKTEISLQDDGKTLKVFISN